MRKAADRSKYMYTLLQIEQHILMMLSNNVSSSLKPPEKEIINFAFTSQPTFQDRLPVTNSSAFPGLTNSIAVMGSAAPYSEDIRLEF